MGVALETNTKLKYVHLEHNKIGDEAAAAIGKGITNHGALLDLVLEHNIIGDIGAAAIGEALELNRMLAKLELENNKIHNDGVVAIAKGLMNYHSKLVYLDLTENRIGDEGALALANMLDDNKNSKVKKVPTLVHTSLHFTSLCHVPERAGLPVRYAT